MSTYWFLASTTLLLGIGTAFGTAGAVTLHVAPGGNDAWSGTPQAPNADGTDGPKASLAGARDAVRALKAKGPLTEPVDIILADGTYALTETLALAPEDSGTADCPITYAAAPGAHPVVSGGRRITDWRQGEGGLWEA
ncbi:MAG: right-handed parallel beta-helix repeat-containing protein, partial [Candidatus Hydrogenedentes bacterium]|nr:right-handed parallel beta-helix repeat-containing protein [Candidatus Hydrogenedentota bacterium]